MPAGVERWAVDDAAAWHRRRAKDVTASIAGALLGIHEFTSYYDLFHAKAGNIPPGSEETDAMYRGRVLEPIAIEKIRKDHEEAGWHVAPGGFYYRRAASRLGATPDVFAWDPLREGFGTIQVKSVEPSVYREKWLGEDGIPQPPDWIVLQVLIEAYLSGASWAAVSPLTIGHAIEAPIIPVAFHPGIIKRIERESLRFWDRVEADNAPEPDFRTDGATIAALYPEDNGQEVDLTGSNELPALADEFDDIQARMAADKARLDEIKAAFRYAMGPNQSARISSGRRITLRTLTRQPSWMAGWTGRVLRIGGSNNG